MTKDEIEAIFGTPQKKRCRDCGYLILSDDGKWICDDCGKDIHDIPNEECSANQDW